MGLLLGYGNGVVFIHSSTLHNLILILLSLNRCLFVNSFITLSHRHSHPALPKRVFIHSFITPSYPNSHPALSKPVVIHIHI